MLLSHMTGYLLAFQIIVYIPKLILEVIVYVLLLRKVERSTRGNCFSQLHFVHYFKRSDCCKMVFVCPCALFITETALLIST
jgi:hypothetical protein